MGKLNPYKSSVHCEAAVAIRTAQRAKRLALIGWCIVVLAVAAMMTQVEVPPISHIFNSLGDYSICIVFVPALYWEILCRYSSRERAITWAISSSLLRCLFVYWIGSLVVFFILSAITRSGPFGDVATTRDVSRMLFAVSLVIGSAVLACYDLWIAKSEVRTELLHAWETSALSGLTSTSSPPSP